MAIWSALFVTVGPRYVPCAQRPDDGTISIARYAVSQRRARMAEWAALFRPTLPCWCDARRAARALERQHDVHDLLAPAWRLHVGQLATSAVADPRLRHPVVCHRVVRGDVLRPHHACHPQHAQLSVDLDLLARVDDEIAIRQHLRHHAGYPHRHRLAALDLTGAGVVVGTV